MTWGRFDWLHFHLTFSFYNKVVNCVFYRVFFFSILTNYLLLFTFGLILNFDSSAVRILFTRIMKRTNEL